MDYNHHQAYNDASHLGSGGNSVVSITDKEATMGTMRRCWSDCSDMQVLHFRYRM